MYEVRGYDRIHACEYARRWALGRNPLFYDFQDIGGDCTNFISQCVYAGCCQMNVSENGGWYYFSAGSRAPSWTGVEFFHDFLIGNKGPGPFGSETAAAATEPGDVIQLGGGDGDFYHTLLITGRAGDDFLVAAHTYDALDRPLSTYSFRRARYIHIAGCRVLTAAPPRACFDDLINGRAL